ncbi:MAG: MFS transporter [Rhodospirillaceae bacterium]|jgi:MFS family permease|nr:MFS transporter [Rhodospirillaceae bacterium]MBT5456736.1 MFS transporter [Rhodospirillaceae bacterium]
MQPSPQDDPVPWRIQGAVYGMGMFCTSVYYMMVVVVPVFVISLDLSYLLAGIILGCRPILSLIFSIHAGALMDRIGSRRVMIFFATVGILAPLMYPLSPWVGWLGLLVVAQMLAGLADSMGWLGAQTLIGQHMKGRTKYSGRLSATIRIGHAIAPIMVGHAWDSWGAWAAFGLMSVWNLGFLGCALLLPAGAHHGQNGTAATEPNVSRFHWRDLLPNMTDYVSAFRLLAIPAVAATVMIGMMPHVGNYVQSTFYVIWLEQEGITGTLIGVLISIASIAAACGSLLAARLRRIIPPYWLFLTTVWLAIMVICATPLIGGPVFTGLIGGMLSPLNDVQDVFRITPLVVLFAAFACALALRSGFNGIQQPLVISLVLTTAGSESQGKALGLRATANRITSIGTPIAMGAIADWLSLEAAFYVIALIATAAMVLMTIYVIRHPAIHDAARER